MADYYTKDQLPDIKWKIGDVLIVYIICFTLYIVISALIIYSVLATGPIEAYHLHGALTPRIWQEIITNYWYLFGLVFVVEQLLLISIPILYIKKKKYGGLAALGVRPSHVLKNLFIGCVFGFGFRIAFSLPIILLMTMGAHKVIEPTIRSFYLNWLTIIGILIIGPIGESILLTGFTFPAFAKRFSSRTSAVLTATIFVILHLTYFEKLNLFLILLYFVIEIGAIWLYIKRKTLFAPIGFHMASNLLYIILLVINTSILSPVSPDTTIRYLYHYSRTEDWSAVQNLMFTGALRENDKKLLHTLFTTDSVISIEATILERNDIGAKVLLTLVTPLGKKCGLYPIVLVFRNNCWKIAYEDSLSSSLRLENYVLCDEAEKFYIQGNYYRMLEYYDLAIQSYSKSKELKPDVAYPYWGLGTAHMELKQYDKAIDFFKQATEIDTSLAPVFYNLGLAYYYLGYDNQAIASLKRAIGLQSELTDAYIWLAYLYCESGELNNASRSIQEAITLSPHSAALFNCRGYVHYYQKKYDNALKDFMEAIQLNNKYKDSYIGLAITYYKKQNSELAIRNYKKAIMLDNRYASRTSLSELQDEGLVYSDSIVTTMQEILERIESNK